MYDLILVGLGPAGAVLARLLGGSYSILALDRKTPARPGGFQKPCGGLLAPDAQKALARFEWTLPKEVAVDPQIFSVRTLDLDTGAVRHYQRFYINVDRHKLDCALLAGLPKRVETVYGARCTGIREAENGYHVTYTAAGHTYTAAGRYLVGADGANSVVRRTLFPGREARRYVAIQQWFAEQNPKPFYSCVFDSAATDCYSWSISKDGFFIFGGAYPMQNCRARFEAQKERLQAHGFQFGEPVKTEACMVVRPRGPGDFLCGRGNAFLIGEAAGFVSPSSLEGISSAIESARALAGVLRTGGKDPQHAYRRATRGLRMKLTCKLFKCPFLYGPFLRRLVMASGLQSIRLEELDPH